MNPNKTDIVKKLNNLINTFQHEPTLKTEWEKEAEKLYDEMECLVTTPEPGWPSMGLPKITIDGNEYWLNKYCITPFNFIPMPVSVETNEQIIN